MYTSSSKTKVLKKNMHRAKSYKIMHVHSASHFEFWYNFIVVLGIFLGPLASMITTIGTAVNSRPVNVFDILSSVISFVSGVAVGVLKFGKYDQVSIMHKNAAAQYSTLERTIRRYESIPTHIQDPFHQFSKFIGDSLDALLKQSPAIPSKITNRYVVMAKRLNISIPSEIDMGYATDDETSTPRQSEGPVDYTTTTIGPKAMDHMQHEHCPPPFPPISPQAPKSLLVSLSTPDAQDTISVADSVTGSSCKKTLNFQRVLNEEVYLKTPSFDKERIEYEVARLIE